MIIFSLIRQILCSHRSPMLLGLVLTKAGLKIGIRCPDCRAVRSRGWVG